MKTLTDEDVAIYSPQGISNAPAVDWRVFDALSPIPETTRVHILPDGPLRYSYKVARTEPLYMDGEIPSYRHILVRSRTP